MARFHLFTLAAAAALLAGGPPSSAGGGKECRAWSRTLAQSGGFQRPDGLERILADEKLASPECLARAAEEESDPALAVLLRAAAAYRGHATALTTFGADLEDPAYRNALAYLIGLPRKPSTSFILATLRSGDAGIKRLLAPRLADVGDASLIRVLFDSLADPDLREGSRAALLLLAADPENTRSFAHALGHPGHRPAVVDIFSQIESPAVAAEWQKFLALQEPESREAAAQILGLMAVPGTAEALTLALADPVPEVRAAAGEALGGTSNDGLPRKAHE